MTAQTQQGIVKTIGKPGHKGQALSGVTVRVKGEHNAAVSRADGTFSLAMSGKKNGQPYTLQQVQKSGYELNEKMVLGRQYAFSSTVPLTIVMVSTAQLQADKQRIEQNAYHKDDTFVPLKKQLLMMRTILHLYNESKRKIAEGRPVSQIVKSGIMEKVIKIKYEIPNDQLELFDNYINEITETLDSLSDEDEWRAE